MRLHRRRCIPIPIPYESIDRIHYVVDKQKTPEGLTFLWINGTEFGNLLDAPTPVDKNDTLYDVENIVVDNTVDNSTVESIHDNENEEVTVDAEEVWDEHDRMGKGPVPSDNDDDVDILNAEEIPNHRCRC